MAVCNETSLRIQNISASPAEIEPGIAGLVGQPVTH